MDKQAEVKKKKETGKGQGLITDGKGGIDGMTTPYHPERRQTGLGGTDKCE